MLRAAVAMIAAMCFASGALAAFVPWSNPSGSIPGRYSWGNGGSDNGLFGSPTFDAGGVSFPANGF